MDVRIVSPVGTDCSDGCHLEHMSIPTTANSALLTDKPKLFYLDYIRSKPTNTASVAFRFTAYLSVLSGVQRLEPDVILVHGDEEPVAGKGRKWR